MTTQAAIAAAAAAALCVMTFIIFIIAKRRKDPTKDYDASRRDPNYAHPKRNLEAARTAYQERPVKTIILFTIIVLAIPGFIAYQRFYGKPDGLKITPEHQEKIAKYEGFYPGHHMFAAICLTGGNVGCLDKIDGAEVNYGDAAVVMLPDGREYLYKMVKTDALENYPVIVKPIKNGTLKRWVLVKHTGETEPLKTYPDTEATKRPTDIDVTTWDGEKWAVQKDQAKIDSDHHNVLFITLPEWESPVEAKIVGWVIQYSNPKTRQTYRQWYIPPECTGCKWVRESKANQNPKILRKVSEKVLEDINK